MFREVVKGTARRLGFKANVVVLLLPFVEAELPSWLLGMTFLTLVSFQTHLMEDAAPKVISIIVCMVLRAVSCLEDSKQMFVT